jgi:hypothetical protein
MSVNIILLIFKNIRKFNKKLVRTKVSEILKVVLTLVSKLLKITSFFKGVLKIPLLKQVLVFPISVPVLKL